MVKLRKNDLEQGGPLGAIASNFSRNVTVILASDAHKSIVPSRAAMSRIVSSAKGTCNQLALSEVGSRPEMTKAMVFSYLASSWATVFGAFHALDIVRIP